MLRRALPDTSPTPQAADLPSFASWEGRSMCVQMTFSYSNFFKTDEKSKQVLLKFVGSGVAEQEV